MDKISTGRKTDDMGLGPVSTDSHALRFEERVTAAEKYIADRGLKSVAPSPENLRYLFIELGLPRNVLSKMLKTQKLNFLLERVGIERKRHRGVSQPLTTLPEPVCEIDFEKTDHARGVPSTYAVQLADAVRYVVDRHLYEVKPNAIHIRYLCGELGLPLPVVATLLPRSQPIRLAARAGVDSVRFNIHGNEVLEDYAARIPEAMRYLDKRVRAGFNREAAVTVIALLDRASKANSEHVPASSSVASQDAKDDDEAPNLGRINANDHEKTHVRYERERQDAARYIEGRNLHETHPSRGDLEHLYITLRLSANLLAELLGCSSATVRSWLALAGLERRTAAAQKHIRNAMNEAFFKSWTPEMAWVLGLLFTDGHLSGEREVVLASTDRELLKKVRALVAPELRITAHRQGYDSSKFIGRIALCHPGVIADLKALGLQERKSLIMSFPEVPPAVVRDFIRGCWDGDGGYSLSNEKLTGHYTCGSLPFITRIRDELFRAGVWKRVLHYGTFDYQDFLRTYGTGPYPITIYQRANARAYDLRIAGDEQLFAIYRFLYDGASPSICLSRKRDLLTEYLRRQGLFSSSAPDGQDSLESS